MKTIIFFLAISILIESSITTLPLTLLIILFASIWVRNSDVFLIAFFAGFFLDILAFKHFGWSSMYFTLFVYAIFLYQRKFEIMTFSFVMLAGFIGSFGYLIMQGSGVAVFQALICAIFSSLSFFVFKIFNKKARSKSPGQVIKYV